MAVRVRLRMLGRRVGRWLGVARRGLPMVLDVAGWSLVVVGVGVLFGAWAWIAAGFVLILAGLRAGS